MRCRRLKTSENGRKNIVWFGSYGVNSDGTAKFYSENDKHDNYGTEKEAVIDSLTQRLSVIKGELWYNVSAGLPLLEKYRKKGIIDAYVVTVVLKHPDVNDIIEFNSTQNNTKYECKFICDTIYGELEVKI